MDKNFYEQNKEEIWKKFFLQGLSVVKRYGLQLSDTKNIVLSTITNILEKIHIDGFHSIKDLNSYFFKVLYNEIIAFFKAKGKWLIDELTDNLVEQTAEIHKRSIINELESLDTILTIFLEQFPWLNEFIISGLTPNKKMANKRKLEIFICSKCLGYCSEAIKEIYGFPSTNAADQYLSRVTRELKVFFIQSGKS